MTKKNSFLFVVATTVTLLMSACILNFDGVVGKGSVVEQDINVTDFTSIESSSSADITVTKGTALRVVLSDYENLIDSWDIRVVNNTLLVQIKPFTSIMNSRAKVTIELPGDLYEINMSGSGDMNINSAFSGIEELSISGSGSIKGNAVTTYSDLRLSITGSGSINLAGSANELKASTTGSGKMYLKDLVAKYVDCTISGSGDMYVNATETLNANISGSGDIIYSGHPIIDVKTTGSGRIRHN